MGWVKEITGGYSLPQFLFHAALCCFAMARTSKDRKYISTARSCVKLLKTWAKKGCPNFPHNILLLEAEDKDLRKQRTKAASSYEKSIKVAKDLKRLQDEAIANEKYAAFQRRRGNMDAANVYLEESIRLYRRWGASKKVEQLLSMMQ
uniref:Uncharacterized protein n=1 Tax=Craspedostauros australis TaxID=1486917 RepID=A0A7R9WNS1_9STRA